MGIEELNVKRQSSQININRHEEQEQDQLRSQQQNLAQQANLRANGIIPDQENEPILTRIATPATTYMQIQGDTKCAKRARKHQRKLMSTRMELDLMEIGDQTRESRYKILEKRFLAIQQELDMKVNMAKSEDAYTDHKKRELESDYYRQRAEAYDELIKSGTITDQEELNRLYREKEKAQVSQHTLAKRNKIDLIENPAERKRELKTYDRHKRFDFLKTFLYTPTRLAIEGARFIQNGKQLVNVGRAFMGGTKPMYYFEDRNDPIIKNGQVVGYKRYLYKEAVNCVGRKKTQGAVVTEATSKLQKEICGDMAIDAFAAVENGEVLGSFQVMIDKMDAEHEVDLFSWQENPEKEIPQQAIDEVMREHTLDWLLCNFDTKGENFLHRKSDGHFSSFDKEASFSFIEDPESQRMSCTYKPHSNDTIYNVMFRQYIKGASNMNINFDAMRENAARIAGMDNSRYMEMFEPMLRRKYKDKDDYNRVYQLILQRKTGLVEEYNRFFRYLKSQRELYREGRSEFN